MINKEKIEELMSISGQVKDVVFQTDADYILKKYGEEGLAKLEKRAEELNIPINYKEANSLKLCPIGLRVLSLLLMRDVFGLSDSEIREIGYSAPATSFVVKLLMRFLSSFSRLAKEVPNYWKNHYTIGSLESVYLNEKTKDLIVHLKDFKVDPILCIYFEGYFRRIYEFAVGFGNGECKETKCMFKGAPYHEYVFRTRK